MTDTPGRLLSSLSNADGKPKVGGCVGVFFQLFDWNRRLSGKHLFSTKSLPAERPRSNKFNDEKLPMAKLLLIADENRSLFPRNSSSESQSEVGSERSSEGGSSKKPGVVARLMGLESFPEADLHQSHHQSKELKQQSPQHHHHHKMHHYQELQMLEDLLQGQPEDFRNRRDMPPTSMNKPCLREEKMPKNTKKNQDPMDKFAKFPLSPKKSSASILSTSKSNKVTPPIKSQSKRTALLMGAAARILEQPSSSRMLLLGKASDSDAGDTSTAKAAQCSNGFHSDLKKKSSKQVQNVNCEKQDVKKGGGLMKSSASLLQGRSGSKTGSSRDSNCKRSCNPKQQQLQGLSKSSKPEEARTCEDQASFSEHDDESQSVDCDSQDSSCKENRIIAVKLEKVIPKLSRSGSVKEEQPPTPPSRGSLFRSKSVREEADKSAQPLQPFQQVSSASKTTPSGGKEVRLKREKRQRQQESSPEPAVQKPDVTRRKPALDQGRTKTQQEAQRSKTAASPKQSPRTVQEQHSKNAGGLLSYDRLFGARKQAKSSSSKDTGEAAKNKSDEKSKKVLEESVETKSKSEKKGTESSLMKSLLRRKPLSKAETVSSSKKKVVEKPKSEKQRRASPLQTVKEVAKQCNPGAEDGLVEVLNETNELDAPEEQQSKLDDPVFDVSPEKLHLHGAERVRFEPDKLADKSLEEILKTILSKSLARTGRGDSPLSKGGDDATVIDMDLSPGEEVEPTIQQLDDLPCKVLQFEDDGDEKQAATPLPLDTNDCKVEACGATEDSDQPSPVCVLDFSALQSPFPSDVTTSCDETDEDGKQVLESDADSAGTVSQEDVTKTPDLSPESYGVNFLEFPELETPVLVGGGEDSTNYEGQEIDNYVREVLMGSGFASEDPSEEPTLATTAASIPCTEEIFQQLEQQRSVQGMIEFSSDDRKFETPGSCHKLMYECIAEALNLVMDPYREESLVTTVSGNGIACLRKRPFGEDLVTEVSSYILSWREMTLGMVDDLVEVDMNSASGKWKDLRDENSELVMDLERMIFRSMIEDLISDLGLRLRSTHLRRATDTLN